MPKRTAIRLTKTTIEKVPQGATVWDSEVPGFGLRVTKAGCRTFIFQFRLHRSEQGKITIGKFPAMTVEEARKLAREHRVNVDKGNSPSQKRKEAREAATLAELADHYCNVYGPHRGLKPQTLADARSLLDRFAIPRFGNRKVADLTTGDVRAMHNLARVEVSRYQANKLRAVLSRVFTLAIQNGWRTSNPCVGVEKFPEDQRWVHLTASQVTQLLQACDELDDQDGADAVRLLLFTGARLREVLNATWSQFDLEQGLWVKPSSHTKTKIVHRVHLAPEAVAILQRRKAEALHDEFVFPGQDLAKPRTDLKRPWKNILAKAKIGHFRLHDLRRTNATFMLSTGSDLMTVGKTLGHTQASTTLRYASLHSEVQKEGVTRATALMVRGALTNECPREIAA